MRGRFRAVQVWVGSPGSTIEAASFIPPAPAEIPRLVTELLDWWSVRHERLLESQKPEIAFGLAEFHHKFLSIHPFLDANGRVARSLVDQAARELLNQGLTAELTADRPKYFGALAEADKGNLGPLTQRLIASLG